MTIPTRDEINIFDSLDEQEACKNFLGKSLDEAEMLFRNSEASNGDCEAAQFLLAPLETRLNDEPNEMVPVAERLAVLCNYVVEHRQKFDCDDDMANRYLVLRDGFLSLVK